MDQPIAGSAGQQLVGQPMASKATSRDLYDGPPPQQAQYGIGMRPGGGGGGGTGTGMGVGSGMGMGSSSGGGVSGLGPGGGQQSGRSPSKRRQPMSIAASDVREFHTRHTCIILVLLV